MMWVALGPPLYAKYEQHQKNKNTNESKPELNPLLKTSSKENTQNLIDNSACIFG